jgi:hypothetical protein
MILISHRGNISGPNPEQENHPDYIWAAIQAGYDVEVDVWFENGKFMLGHDEPQYEFPFGLIKIITLSYGFIVKIWMLFLN